MPSDWTNAFGGQVVKPADVQYQEITFGANTALFWPTESMAGVPYVAAQIDGDATGAGLALVMPDARQGATGVATCIANIGAHSFDIHDNSGGVIGTLATGTAWILVLTDNSTQAGTWRLIQLGALTSQAQASALAGAGLEAAAARLRSTLLSTTVSVNTTLDGTFRANCVVWNAGAGILTLDPTATLGVGWWAWITNEGSAAITVATTGGETINGVASLTMPARTNGDFYSMLVVADAGKFHAIARGPLILPIAGGGTGADNSDDALVNLGGSTIGISIFEAPTAGAILGILGIDPTAITENTINNDTVVTSADGGTAYECRADLNLTLPPTIQVNKHFFILVDARKGIVTIVPDPADQIADQAAGTNFVMARDTSALFITDGNSDWWPLFLGDSGIPWASATGADIITASYSPAITELTTGLLVGIRADSANLTTTPTFAPDGLDAKAIQKNGNRPLTPGDIAFSNADYLLRYDGNHWQLLNPSTTEPPWAVAGGTANAIIATYPTPNGSLWDGLLLTFRALGRNTSAAPTFAPDGLTAHPIVKTGGHALVAGDIPGAGTQCLVQYDLANTRWELLNPSSAGGIAVLEFGNVDTGTTVMKAIDLTNYTGFNRIDILLNSVLRSSAVDMLIEFSTDGGATWIAANYVWGASILDTAYSYANNASTGDTLIGHLIGASPPFPTVNGTVSLYNMNAPHTARFKSDLAGSEQTYVAVGSNSATSVNAVRIRTFSGTITGGTYTVVGYP